MAYSEFGDEIIVMDRYTPKKGTLRNIIEWLLIYFACVAVWFAVFMTFAYKAIVTGDEIPLAFILLGSSALGVDMLAMVITGRLFSHKKRNWVYRDELEDFLRQHKLQRETVKL